ncbi:transglutaminase family protein, partial [Nocardioides marmoraquaticus]
AVAAAQLLAAGLALLSAWALAVGVPLLPRPASVRLLVEALERGAVVLGTDLSPVDRSLGAVHLLLLGCFLLLLWGVDVLAHAVGRPPLAGLPVLAAVSVPVTVLTDPVPTRLYVCAAAAYVLLLACDRGRRHAGAVAVRPVRPEDDALPDGWRERLDTGVGAGQVALVAVLASLLVAPLVPLADPVGPDNGGTGDGDGSGSLRVATQNPFISLRRDLLEQTDTSLLFARTDSTDTDYLRTVVLDQFSADAWDASTRDLPSENSADGVFPAPPGLAAGTGGVESEWELTLDPVFRTRWLPLPSPLREVAVEGDWRYDERFLDVALPSGESRPGLTYRATAFRPAITASDLDRALTAPESVREPMTELPDDMPPVIERTAREVTRGATTPFQQAVALQDWFRQDGGFTYSLEQRPGSGLDLLADFVTTDKVGYCEQFAAAMAAMGRTLGIPSRVAVGFLGPERQPDGRLRYSSDARHAWAEMYFTGVGWVRFEPTPSVRSGASPDYTRESLDESEPTEAPQSAAPTPQAEQTDTEQQTDTSAGGAGLGRPVAVVLVLLLLAAALLAPGVVRRRQRAERLDPARSEGPAEGAWAELRAVALDHGAPWDDDRSPREQAHALVRETPGAEHADAEALEDVLRQVERGRFARPGSPGGTAVLERTDLPATVERWTTLLERRSADAPAPTRLRRRLLPPSLLPRTW